MAISPRLIRRRIRSVGNTKKITKAMELVSASKMRRAIASATASRRYSRAGWEMVASLSGGIDRAAHPLLAEREAKRVLVVIMTSHRGLAGGFNSNMVRKTLEFVRDPSRMRGAGEATEVVFAAVGRKGEEALRRTGRAVVASFATAGDKPSIQDATPIAELARSGFVSGEFDRVYVAYTDFVSAVNQKPVVRQILPVTPEDVASQVEEAAAEGVAGTSIEEEETLFEPSMDAILEAILPRMVDVQVYQALLESSASEHSSRMMAMRNASDAAGDMIDDLSLALNQARQAAITREISEIAAGKATLEEG